MSSFCSDRRTRMIEDQEEPFNFLKGIRKAALHKCHTSEIYKPNSLFFASLCPPTSTILRHCVRRLSLIKMPSLRRTASSPAVRSSPYSNGAVAPRGNGHRRSSGSETTNRRVLADIEWWRVSDGQCDPNADQEQEDRNYGTQGIVPLDVSMGIHIQSVDAGVDRQSPSALSWFSSPASVSSEVCIRL